MVAMPVFQRFSMGGSRDLDLKFVFSKSGRTIDTARRIVSCAVHSVRLFRAKLRR
jgi:hypothetical protein